MEDSSDVKSDRNRGPGDWESEDRRKQKLSKSRKLGNGDEAEELDDVGRRSAGDRNESRKRSGGSSRTASDEDDYEARKDSRAKQMKKHQEESTLEKLSSWYEDGEQENRHDGGDRSGNRGHGRTDEGERRKLTSKYSDYDSSQGRNKGKDDKSYDRELEKVDRDARYSERREASREKDHGSSEHGRNPRRRWDEPDAVKTAEENNYVEIIDVKSGKSSDPKHGSARERTMSSTIEPSTSKSRGMDSTIDKGMKPNDERIDTERSKSKGRLEAREEESSVARDGKERMDKHRQQKSSASRDAYESRERPFSIEEDGMWARGTSRREMAHSDRSKTPERSGRHHHESENVEIDYERGSKDNWKRRQPSSSEKEIKDGDFSYNHSREWEFQRHGRERTDIERPQGRSGRKDGNRTEAVKTSSNYGISNENYDVIEIQTNPHDYGRENPSRFNSRRSEVALPSDTKSATNDEWAQSGDDSKSNRFTDDGPPLQNSKSWRDDEFQGGKTRGQRGVMSGRPAGGQTSSSGSQPPHGNQEPGFFGRSGPQGAKGNIGGRGGRVRPSGRENQPFGIPVPLMGSPFGPLGMPPPGPMQPLNPNMSPAPGPPISPNMFMPPFSPPVVWHGGRGVEMNMLVVPPGLSPVPPGAGPSGPRFGPNMGTPPNPSMYFNQPGMGRGDPPNMTAAGVNAMGPVGRGPLQDKSSGNWVPPRTNGPTGKAPSRGEQNDYSQNFVDTGMRPQNFIRELDPTTVVEDYPKLRELIQKKDEIVVKSASPPMYYKCDLREHVLSPEFFGTKFDVILVDPPWEEYAHRAPGVTDHMEYWTFEEIMNLKIEAIADTPSFIFLWVGDGLGLEQGRQCLKKWGFRRCEDICWVKTNKTNATPGLRHDSHTLFQRSKEHCLMGIKGTVRRSTDGHIIHANIDTDVIIAEEPPYGSTAKPEDMYRIIEHFALGRRRIELFGEDHNIRSGWLTVGKGLSSSNFNSEAYVRNFSDKDGKVWQGGGGRNPPPEAPHLVLTTPEIELLRPKSPMKNQQQMQQQSASISLTPSNSTNKLATLNSPQNPNAIGLNQEASSSNFSGPGPWAPPAEGFKGREGGNMGPDDRFFDMYGYNMFGGQANGDYRDFESHRALNML